jgi:hypothetical protein
MGIPKDITKLYQKFLKGDLSEDRKKLPPKKCKAKLRRCRKCEYKFKKGEEVCPECNTPRETCNNYALPGKDICKIHGGSDKVGRPMTTGANVSSKSFTQEEWVIIKQRMKEKTREHEFAIQIAQMAFEKVVKDTDEPIKILAVAAEYFSKIVRYVKDIDIQQANMVHFHTFDEISKHKLEKFTLDISNEVLKNALFIIVGVVRKHIDNDDLFNKIFSDFPKIYQDLYFEKAGKISSNPSQ